MITRRTLVGAALSAPLLSLAPRAARAADWPSAGPIRLVVASGAGGNADVVARLVAAQLEETLGQSIVVENLSASSGMQATQAVSEAEADGYTLLVGTSSQLVHNIALFEPLPVDITNTLRGVAMMNEVPMVMLVNNDEESEDLEAFIAKLSADPGAYQYGSGPAGTTTHITGALFLSRLGLDITHVPYPKSGEALRDTIAGRLTFQFIPALSGVPQIRDGAVRSLGVAAPERLSALPDLPTISEAGLDGFVSQTWNSIAAPAGTPEAIVERLNAEVNAIVQSEAVKSQLTDLGSLVPAAMSPAQVDGYYAEQRDIWIPVARETGVRRNSG
ncbi:MAG: tripartite tricarboxylate transporter substrate binding protein [Pseudomonadota bacterium]